MHHSNYLYIMLGYTRKQNIMICAFLEMSKLYIYVICIYVYVFVYAYICANLEDNHSIQDDIESVRERPIAF